MVITFLSVLAAVAVVPLWLVAFTYWNLFRKEIAGTNDTAEAAVARMAARFSGRSLDVLYLEAAFKWTTAALVPSLWLLVWGLS